MVRRICVRIETTVESINPPKLYYTAHVHTFELRPLVGVIMSIFKNKGNPISKQSISVMPSAILNI